VNEYSLGEIYEGGKATLFRLGERALRGQAQHQLPFCHHFPFDACLCFELPKLADLSQFTAINPCGLEAGVMGSISSVLGRPVAMDDVKARVRQHVSDVFGRATA